MNYSDKEKDRLDNFKSGHICYDLKPHHNTKLVFEVTHSSASGIGSNTYIRCNLCGSGLEVTDYEVW